MTSLYEDIEGFICTRIQQAYQEIKDEPEFKALRAEIVSLDEKLRKERPSDILGLFDVYAEYVEKRSGLIQEKVYRTGFSDGTTMLKKLP